VLFRSNQVDSDGLYWVRVSFMGGPQSIAESPVPANFKPPVWSNAYPPPGQSGKVEPFSGEVPVVAEEP
jgi:hypothetical protein